jgi:hypothetical protein
MVSTWMKRLGRVIKIVEGAELEVLKGVVKTLKGYDMRQIADEYYILEPRRAQTCR